MCISVTINVALLTIIYIQYVNKILDKDKDNSTFYFLTEGNVLLSLYKVVTIFYYGFSFSIYIIHRFLEKVK